MTDSLEFAVFALPTYFADRDGPQGPYMRRFVDFLASAEELGDDSVWANEHHFHPYGGFIPSPAVMLAALAQRTSRVRLGTSIVVLPLHQPHEIAEQFAMVDLMSGGRVELGVGRGFVTHDYELLGIPVDEGQDRTVEALEVILKAWERQPFSHSGKYYRYSDIEVWPFPEQEPHPPIWIAATTNPKSFELVGTLGHDLLTVAYLRPLTDLAASVRLYREALAAAGHDASGHRVGTHYQVVVDEDGAKARRIAHEALERYARQLMGLQQMATTPGTPRPELRTVQSLSIEQAVEDGRILAGTPDECVTIIERAREAIGLTSVDCTFTFGGIDLETARRSMHLLATEVIPRLKATSLAASR
jgi:natural product biosynthesis luciferase-like monooxygenase protein